MLQQFLGNQCQIPCGCFGFLPIGIQSVGIDKGRTGTSQCCGTVIHHGNKGFFTAAQMLCHCYCRIIGRCHRNGFKHVIQ